MDHHHSGPHRVDLVVYPGFKALEAVGPMSVFDYANVHLRRRGRLPQTDDAVDTELEAHDVMLPPAAADAGLLARAMGRLPDATRSVLWLYHAEGYTHDEIAGLMGRTPSFSKSQLARGTRRLRDLLKIDTETRTHA